MITVLVKEKSFVPTTKKVTDFGKINRWTNRQHQKIKKIGYRMFRFFFSGVSCRMLSEYEYFSLANLSSRNMAVKMNASIYQIE